MKASQAATMARFSASSTGAGLRGGVVLVHRFFPAMSLIRA